MNESPQTPEGNIEKLPTREQIEATFLVTLQAINEPKVFQEPLIEFDEDGNIKVYEVVVMIGQKKCEFGYKTSGKNYRNPKLPPGAQYAASIHIAYYETKDDHFPYNGDCLANYIDERWEYPMVLTQIP